MKSKYVLKKKEQFIECLNIKQIFLLTEIKRGTVLPLELNCEKKSDSEELLLLSNIEYANQRLLALIYKSRFY